MRKNLTILFVVAFTNLAVGITERGGVHTDRRLLKDADEVEQFLQISLRFNLGG